MFRTLALLGLSAASLVAGHPMNKRQALSATDVDVLQLAHYLENLEHALYAMGCKKFSQQQYSAAGFPDGFRDNVCLIAQHEKTHIATLATVLTDGGQVPLPKCEYLFPFSDPKSFVDLGNMISSGGIGAYLGGSTLLTDNPVLEEAGASILAVESRHDTYLRTGLGASPFPTAFDTGLTATWIFNIAQAFIKSCPQQLPIVTLPKLAITSPAPSPNLEPIPAGTQIAFEWDPSTFFVPVDPSAPLFIAMVNQNVSAPIFQEVTITGTGKGTVPLPEGVAGAAFACLTTFASGLTLQELSDFGTLAGPTELIVS